MLSNKHTKWSESTLVTSVLQLLSSPTSASSNIIAHACALLNEETKMQENNMIN